mgnify:FL=1
MDTMKYNHKELPLVPFSELKGKTYVILSAHLYLQSIIAGWCGTNPAPVLLLQKRIVSYFECVTSKHFFYIMLESQLFLSAVAQRLDFVVLQDEIAIWAKQVVGHQIGVV